MKAGLQDLQPVSVGVLYHSMTQNPYGAVMVLIGIAFYVAAVPAWIIALKRFDLSFAYPMLSLGYLIVYIGAYYWPGMEESITWQKTLGVSLIVLGVAYSAQPSKPCSRDQHEKLIDA